jgi:protocatechuate 3,4-dioxygenase beta subunit
MTPRRRLVVLDRSLMRNFYMMTRSSASAASDAAHDVGRGKPFTGSARRMGVVARRALPIAGLLVLLIGVLVLTRPEPRLPEPPAPVDGDRPAAEMPPNLADPGAPAPSAGEEPAAPTGRVRVHVSESDDSLEFPPIPGARVSLRDSAGVVHEAVTDEKGEVVFEGVPPGESAVQAVARGYVQSEWRTGEGERRLVLLDRGIALEGEVVDGRTSRPVAGAEVRVESGRPLYIRHEAYHGYPNAGNAIAHAVVRTGEDGRFRVDAVPQHRPLYVTARAHGLGPNRVAVTTPALDAAPPYVIVAIEPRGALRGTVLDREGRAAPGAFVCVAPAREKDLVETLRQGTYQQHFWGDQRVLSGVADGQGRFRVEGLELGLPYVAVANAGRKGYSALATDLVCTEGSPEREVDLRVRLEGKIEIRILDPDGDPAGKATVTIGASGWGGSTVPNSGVHHFWNLPPGPMTILVWGHGHPNEKRVVEIPAGGKATVTVRLTRGVAMEGVVVDGEGKPIAGAKVSANHLDDEGWSLSLARGETDEKGRVRLVGLRPLVHKIEVEAEGLAPGTGTADPRGGEFRIRLTRGGLLRGRVEGATDKGVVEARGAVVQRAITDDAGRFEIRLPPGLYRARTLFMADGEWSHQFEITEGGVTEITLRLP